MRYFSLSLFCCLLLASCNQKTSKEEVISLFADSEIRKIIEFQDKRSTDSLRPYLFHEKPLYRKLATVAFGSVQDPLVISDLFSVLMNDPDTTIRLYAAYAMGQTGDSLAYEKLREALNHEQDPMVRAKMLEAMGRTVPQRLLSGYNTYEATSIPERKGLMKGFYYAALRNVHDALSIEKAVSALKSDQPFEVRYAAADMLTRVPAIDTMHTEDLINAADFDLAPEVRMRVATVLGKLGDNRAMVKLQRLTTDMDDRVKASAAAALSNYEKTNALQAIISLLNSKNIQVAVMAAESYARFSDKFIKENINFPMLEITHWRARYLVLGKKLAVSGDKTISDGLIEEYQKEEDPFKKAAILRALGNDMSQFEFIVGETFKSVGGTVSSAGIETLARMRRMENFPVSKQSEFNTILQRAILTGDLAMVATMSQVLMNEDLGLKGKFDDFSFLEEAKSKLSLPADNETLQMLEKAIAYVNDVEYKEVVNEWNHPIDFELLQTLSDSAEMLIQTSAGDIKIRLLPQEAPGSVANFVNLAAKGYYDGIAFHRVVSNFVVQAGCNRGDGYGGLDYSIRSELGPRKYKEGSVGMASAGKDTEGTQFFITHVTTSHLDGRYTIFAEVTEGMEVVHKIEVGTVIKKVIPVTASADN